MIDAKADKLKANLEERVKTAMDRYYKSQAAGRKEGRRRPLLRRKNNFVRGGMGIMCNVSPPPDQSPEHLRRRNHGVSHSQVIFPV